MNFSARSAITPAPEPEFDTLFSTLEDKVKSPMKDLAGSTIYLRRNISYKGTQIKPFSLESKQHSLQDKKRVSYFIEN